VGGGWGGGCNCHGSPASRCLNVGHILLSAPTQTRRSCKLDPAPQLQSCRHNMREKPMCAHTRRRRRGRRVRVVPREATGVQRGDWQFVSVFDTRKRLKEWNCNI
jgi:hypothetical protein